MNKMILIGNLVRDPELRTTPSGVSVCNFDVAVNERRGGQDTTSYFRVAAWRQLGEICQKYLAKGRKVCVTGEVRARAYQGNDGTPRAALEVTAENVHFLSGRADSEAASGSSAPSAATQAGGFTAVETDELPF